MKQSIAARLLMRAIRFYRKNVSPAKIPSCRFTPTCSAYALEAIGTHGAIKGGLLSIYRILRCNPFCKGGYDPVPPKKQRGKDVHKQNQTPQQGVK